MMRSRRLNILFSITAFFVIAAGSRGARAGSTSDWEASSGLLPTQISPPYTNVNSGPATYTLSGGVLTMTTSPDDYFIQTAPTINMSQAFSIEFGVRFVSGSSSLNDREPVEVTFSTAPGVGLPLWIGDRVVFFQDPNFVRGPTAFVATSDRIHNYQIDVATSGVVTLSYDGIQILTDQTFSSVAFNGLTPRILWGDGTQFASGTSEWTYFRQNALSVPEPSALALLSTGLPFVLFLRRWSRSR
jgi:hypothetical protein